MAREAFLRFLRLPLAVRFLVILLLLLIPQLPFLTADADFHLSTSRAPWTDEGLYTLQSRNAVYTGKFDLTQSDGAIIKPLFAGISWLVTKIGDDTMTTMRLVSLLLVVGPLAAFACGSGLFAQATRIVVIPLGYFNYYIFNYSHLALAEAPCSILILAGIWALYARLRGGRFWTLAAASLSMALCYTYKIQFLYVAVIPPLTFAVAIALMFISGLRPMFAESIAQLWRDLGTSILLAGLFGGLLVCFWIMPNWHLFHWVMWTQTGKSFASFTETRWELEQSVLNLAGDLRAWPIVLGGLAGVAALAATWRLPSADAQARHRWIVNLAPAAAFLLVEMHKFLIAGLPSRYLLSLSVAVLLLAGVALEGYRAAGQPVAWKRTAVVALIGSCLLLNLAFDGIAFSQRRFVIHDAQLQFAADPFWRGKTVMGAWAPTLLWGGGTVTIPVWRGYFNDRHILSRFHPAAIVSESDENDSHGAFKADGINLDKVASRVLEFKIAKWNLRVYILPAQP